MWGVGCGVWGVVCGVWGGGWAWGVRSRVCGWRFWGLGCRVVGCEVWICSLRFRAMDCDEKLGLGWRLCHSDFRELFFGCLLVTSGVGAQDLTCRVSPGGMRIERRQSERRQRWFRVGRFEVEGFL